MAIYFYSVNPCPTCGKNGVLLAEAKQLGVEAEFKFVGGMNADIAAAAANGVLLPFFTDGKVYAASAQALLDAEKASAATKSTKAATTDTATTTTTATTDATTEATTDAKPAESTTANDDSGDSAATTSSDATVTTKAA